MSPQLRFATFLFRLIAIVLTIAFVIGAAAALKTLAFTSGDTAHNIGVILADWAGMLSTGFCLSALWVATDVVGRLSGGQAFNPAVIKGLRGIGLNLVLSALSAIVIAPFLKPLFESLGHGATLSLGVDINVQSTTVGMIGLVLFLVAQQGRALKSELESFV